MGADGATRRLQAGERAWVGAAQQADPSARIAALEAELVDLRRAHGEVVAHSTEMTAALRKAEGAPVPWTPDIPAPFRAEAFGRALQEAFPDGGPVVLDALDCAEFPCLAVLAPNPEHGGDAPDLQAALRAFAQDVGRWGDGDLGVLAAASESVEPDGSATSRLAFAIAPGGRLGPGGDLGPRLDWRCEALLEP